MKSQQQAMHCKLQGGPKNVALYFCPYIRQLLTDFQNSFTDTLQTICNNVIIIYPTTP